ncbi:MAG: dTDP-4-dehydrorhamnose 3,5-epimerase family protein [Candidatus Omnitrophota bacterium]
MIEGVEVIALKQISDERGKIMHMLKSTDKHFKKFGEIYFSCVHPGAIKGWHRHKKMTLNYAVPFGKIKLVLFDDRAKSKTKGELTEMFLSPEHYQLVIIPPLVWNGFKGLGVETSIVTNCATLAHDPQEIERLSPFDPSIPYDWSCKHG